MRRSTALGWAILTASLAITVVISRHIPDLDAPPRLIAAALDAPNQTPLSESSECDRVLNSPPANQLNAQTAAGTYGSFSRDVLTPTLKGVPCSLEQISNYMTAAGWLLEGSKARDFENHQFKSNYVLAFYKPDTSLLSYLTRNKSTGLAGFDFLDGKITWITMGPDTRFGG